MVAVELLGITMFIKTKPPLFKGGGFVELSQLDRASRSHMYRRPKSITTYLHLSSYVLIGQHIVGSIIGSPIWIACIPQCENCRPFYEHIFA